MNNYYIKPIAKSSAKKIIIKNHYSHCWTMCSVALGIFEVGSAHKFFVNQTDDKLIGCLIYGNPVGRQVIKSISPRLENGEVLELTRLWIQDDTPKNTESYTIAKSFDWIRNNMPQVKVLVSYADPSQNHLGRIYQATNWLYQSIETTSDVDIMISLKGPDTFEWLHPRSFGARFGFRGKKQIEERIPKPYWVKKNRRKYRYIYLLTDKKEKRQLLKSLNHPISSYPKAIDSDDNEIVCVKE